MECLTGDKDTRRLSTTCMQRKYCHRLIALIVMDDTGCHDCSIRIWDINTKVCVQEITGHRKKFGEAINSVAYHPTHHFMASAGSDALTKVYI
ncbi:unnamed protein product [Trichobilharzia regenti]|nr:unnamed protein product [Trichobilharzia regenti]